MISLLILKKKSYLPEGPERKGRKEGSQWNLGSLAYNIRIV